jgi:hypothetical protein
MLPLWSSDLKVTLEINHFLPTPSQQGLPIHFHTTLPPKLSPYEVRVVGGVYIVVREGLVHVHVNVQSVQKDWSVLIGHEVANESILGEAIGSLELFVWFISLNYLGGPLIIVEWVENLIETRIPLFVIQEIDELVHVYVLCFPSRSTHKSTRELQKYLNVTKAGTFN